MSIIIYHNPRCSKSRQALAYLREHGIRPEIVDYLNAPPSADELEDVLRKLDIEPRDLLRRKESEYKELGLADQDLTREDLIDVLVKNPRLIERPIVICGERAVIGRPTEKILELL